MMTRPQPENVRVIACVGTGTIGSGWAAYFLSRGLDVVGTDPGDGAEERMRRYVEMAWPALEKLGLAPGADQGRLRFTSDLAEAVSEAEFIQESAPDYLDLKQKLFSEIDAAAPSDCVIASSSSVYIPTDIARDCTHKGRCIVGHPFVPSYLIPLVEVVGGEETPVEIVDWAMAFYTHIGKHALRLKKEIEAYIANRLQHAVFNEMYHLVEQGICDFDDVDQAMRYGPGMRWAFAGPLACLHLGGGQGGIRGFLKHFGWSGPPQLEDVAVGEVDQLYGHLSLDELEAWRDENLLLMLKGFKERP